MNIYKWQLIIIIIIMFVKGVHSSHTCYSSILQYITIAKVMQGLCYYYTYMLVNNCNIANISYLYKL